MSLLQVIIGLLVAWTAWKVVQRLVKTSPLDNIPGPTGARPFIYGDLGRFLNRHAWSFHRDLWHTYGPIVRLQGLFGAPLLYVYDPKALYQIVVKDQDIYEETPAFININRLVFGDSLLSSLDEQHRRQRKILNPVFHTNHMRNLIPTFYRITHRLRETLINEINNDQQELDMLNWMTRTALELLGHGGLGYSFDPLDRDFLNPFAEDIKSLVPTFGPLGILIRFLPFLSRIGTSAFRRRILELIPSKRIHRCLEIVDHMDRTSRAILAQRKATLAQDNEALLQQVGEGKDIIGALLRANMQASAEDKMADTEILGHISSIIFAAIDTTSGALAHTLQLLADHQDVQDKLRQEIVVARGDREWMEYDELMALPYLEAVCKETLRLHSPITVISRLTRKDSVLPLLTPIRGNDGTLVNEIPVPKGTGVTIGIVASNVNTTIWGDDAHEWKPERWLEPLLDSVVEAHVPGIYSNLMTFLGGGRACIGFKFSQLEMKVVLVVLLEAFNFRPSDKEVYWNFAGVQFPTVGKTSVKPELPLRVERVR